MWFFLCVAVLPAPLVPISRITTPSVRSALFGLLSRKHPSKRSRRPHEREVSSEISQLILERPNRVRSAVCMEKNGVLHLHTRKAVGGMWDVGQWIGAGGLFTPIIKITSQGRE